MKGPKNIKTGTPSKPVPTGHEVDRWRATSDASSVLTRNFGRFGATVALITFSSFISIEVAHSDIATIVIGAITLAAIIAITVRPLSPP